jgi:alkylated DNA nucleotide flippase Atl1
MPKLELTVGQVIDLVKQLPKEEKSAVFRALSREREIGRDDKSEQEEQQLRALSAERGLDWDRLSDDDRDILVRKLQHKAR